MYLIHKEDNKIAKLEEKTFSELGFKEREHLQEWLANNPDALGEELLMIQKEFSGFHDTNERLDLLALDKQGNLVIIENKLDDSGRNVTWQALKYASYCSSLSKEHIRQIFQSYLDKQLSGNKAEDLLSDFFDGTDYEELVLNQGSKQGIIMVAGKFRKEVTSTVLWLMNYKMRIQCFKVTPFAFNDQLLLNIEQILPIKDTEDFAISMADKTQDDISSQETLKTRHLIRLEFWQIFLKEINKHSHLLNNISPSKDNWIGFGIGISGITINLVIGKSFARSEIYFNRGNQEKNKHAFDFLYGLENELPSDYAKLLNWQRLDEKVSCRIKHQLDGLNVYEKDDWQHMIDFLIKSSIEMETNFRPLLKKMKAYLRN